MKPRILLIDNYDSFTYNLVQAFLVLDADVIVKRNDTIDAAEALAADPTHLVISPGPGRPSDAGRSVEIIGAFVAKAPILGVCLGHQCLVEHFGGEIIAARTLMHGKTSIVTHDGKGIFAGVDNPLEVGRYHSLAADRAQIPGVLEVSARTEDGEIMAIRHAALPIVGVQFHPESVLTPLGPTLLANFLKIEATEDD